MEFSDKQEKHAGIENDVRNSARVRHQCSIGPDAPAPEGGEDCICYFIKEDERVLFFRLLFLCHGVGEFAGRAVLGPYSVVVFVPRRTRSSSSGTI